MDFNNRDNFSSKLGIIAAAAGSAVGLGNIWRFPYVLGENGGGAFFLIYLFFIIVIGMPVMLSELVIGRASQKSIFGAFKVLAPKLPFFNIVGIMGVTAAFLILSFYSVVAGWTVEYSVLAISNQLSDKTPDQLLTIFQEFSSSIWRPAFYLIVFMALTALIVIGGIKNGIERYTKILMPVLLVIIIVLCIKSSTLEGAAEGFVFLFKADFSKISGEIILEALGQAFFSLSIGMGAIATYGSYIQKKENLTNTAISVSIIDTLIAVLAGIAIFPAVFAFGIKPDAGPGLVFVTLPNIFNQMVGGYFFSVVFFILLLIAALTSSVSMLEVVVAYFTDELKIKRKKATVLGAFLMTILGIICIVFPKVFGAFEWTSSNLLLPLGGIMISLFVGWFLSKKVLIRELESSGNKAKLVNIFLIVVKIIAPIAVVLVLLNNLGIFN